MSSQVKSKEEIQQLVRDVAPRLRSLGVTSVGLFGSFARGEQDETSDVDLLVEFEEDKRNFDNFMEVSFLLEDLLGRWVEVVTPEALSPYLGPSILKEVERVPLAA